MFKLLKTDQQTKARLGILKTDHGQIQTPIFMPVGTLATVKAVSQETLKNQIKAQIILGNTYHLYLRPGNDIMFQAGGLHRFMDWDLPILTDSGGYQVFSLSSIRKIEEKGVTFQSHLDGSKHQFTPENVVQTQRILGSDIMMVLDECPPHTSSHDYALKSMELTHRWAACCKREFLESVPIFGHTQMLFGISQGCIYPDLRTESAKVISDMDFDGNAIGGLSVGEPIPVMYEMADLVTNHLPAQKPRYLMGVGTPANILECIARGVDMFDCVMPTRNARNGTVFTWNGIANLRNAKWKTHFKPLDEAFPSDMSSRYDMAYIHHLFRCDELYGLQLASIHNLMFYLDLVNTARKKIEEGSFAGWYPDAVRTLERRL